MNKLDEILAHKRKEVEQLKVKCSADSLQSMAFIRIARPSFSASLRKVPMGLIAEVKKQSPSAGMLWDPFYPREIVSGYADAGAQAISCLIDETYFGGGIHLFAEVRDTVSLPVLYKEFVVDAWQVWQAASLGAAAVLLIVAALDDAELESLMELCRQAGVEALVEVHDEEEMKRAVAAGAECIGVNNRDLKTLEVNLDTAVSLAKLPPTGTTLVSESGIKTSDDVLRMKDAGYHAVLVGEHLLKQDDVEEAARAMMEKVWTSS